MYLTPFDHFMKVASTEALVHGGPPGMPGVNPGWADSDGAEASNTDFALMRAQQNSAPILATPDADGGAGYSHPPAGMSPNVQAHTDVKMATIIAEAEAFADLCYNDIKQAALGDVVNSARAMGGRAVNAVKSVAAPYGHLARDARRFAGEDLAAARSAIRGGADRALGYAHLARDAGRFAANDIGRAVAPIGNAVRDPRVAAGLGVAAGAAALGAGAYAARRFGPQVAEAGSALAGSARQMGGAAMERLSGARNALMGVKEPTLGDTVTTKAQEVWGQAHDRLTAAQSGVQEAAGKAQAYLQNGVTSALESARSAIAQHPVAAAGIGVGAVGGAAGLGVLANRQMEEHKKSAALAEADELGRIYALQQLGLL